MKLITKQLPSEHNIFMFGDVHDGSVLSSEKGWNKLITMMNSEYEGCSNNFGIDGGDMMEAILADDPRFSPEKLTEPLPLRQMDRAIAKRKSIKDKLLLILDGNHERKLWRFGDITAKVCEELGVDYGTFTVKLTIQDTRGKLMYKIYETHGMRSISSTADDPKRRYTNMELILKRHLKFKAGDCAVMVKHHTHKLLVSSPASELYLVDDGKKITQQYTGWGQNESYIHPDARWYGNAGSFLKLYGEDTSGYGELFEFDPVELGFLVLRCRDKRIVSLDKVRLNI